MTVIRQWNPSPGAWETVLIGERGPQGIQGPTGPQGPTGATGPPPAWTQLTQAQYDALGTPNPAVLYIIIG